jgi:hypothetical protein
VGISLRPSAARPRHRSPTGASAIAAAAQRGIELGTLPLRARILPIRTKRMTERLRRQLPPTIALGRASAAAPPLRAPKTPSRAAFPRWTRRARWRSQGLSPGGPPKRGLRPRATRRRGEDAAGFGGVREDAYLGGEVGRSLGWFEDRGEVGVDNESWAELDCLAGE